MYDSLHKYNVEQSKGIKFEEWMMGAGWNMIQKGTSKTSCLKTQIWNFVILRTGDVYLSMIVQVELYMKLTHATDEINQESRKHPIAQTRYRFESMCLSMQIVFCIILETLCIQTRK